MINRGETAVRLEPGGSRTALSRTEADVQELDRVLVLRSLRDTFARRR
ncbi:MAG: hypothetical protein JW747_08670 [Candidatus Aminicenantes bacterium]|nr:hypothetical protein [Candidatus Aminicenantes bacterium]